MLELADVCGDGTEVLGEGIDLALAIGGLASAISTSAHPLHLDREDEVGILAREFDDMIERSVPLYPEVQLLYYRKDVFKAKNVAVPQTMEEWEAAAKKTSGADIPKSGANAVRVENAEGLGEVQAYNDICVCRELLCNAYGCWWHYYYCYC